MSSVCKSAASFACRRILLGKRAERVRADAHPVGQGRDRKVHPAAPVDSPQPGERQRVLVLGDQHVGDEPNSGEAPVAELYGARRSHHPLAAVAACPLLAQRLVHLEAPGHILQDSLAVVADDRHRLAAGWAVLDLGLDDRRLLRQVVRQRPPPVALLRRLRCHRNLGQRQLFGRCLRRRSLAQIGEEHRELLLAQLLRLAAEGVLEQLQHAQLQRRVLVAHLREQRGQLRKHLLGAPRRDQVAQSLDQGALVGGLHRTRTLPVVRFRSMSLW